MAVLILPAATALGQPDWAEESEGLCEIEVQYPHDCDELTFREYSSVSPVVLGPQFTTSDGFEFDNLKGDDLVVETWWYGSSVLAAHVLKLPDCNDTLPVLMTLPQERELVTLLVLASEYKSTGLIAYDSNWSRVDTRIVTASDNDQQYAPQPVTLGNGQTPIMHVALFSKEFDGGWTLPPNYCEAFCNGPGESFITNIRACTP